MQAIDTAAVIAPHTRSGIPIADAVLVVSLAPIPQQHWSCLSADRDTIFLIVLTDVRFQGRLRLVGNINALKVVATAYVITGATAAGVEIRDATVPVLLAGIAFEQRLGLGTHYYARRAVVAANTVADYSSCCADQAYTTTATPVFLVVHGPAEVTIANRNHAAIYHDNIRRFPSEMLNGQTFQSPLAFPCESDSEVWRRGCKDCFIRPSAANGKGFADHDGLSQVERSRGHLDGVAGQRASNRLLECEIVLANSPNSVRKLEMRRSFGPAAVWRGPRPRQLSCRIRVGS